MWTINKQAWGNLTAHINAKILLVYGGFKHIVVGHPWGLVNGSKFIDWPKISRLGLSSFEVTKNPCICMGCTMI